MASTGLTAARPGLPGGFLFVLGAGSVIGTIIAFGLYVTKVTYVSLLPFGAMVVLPALLLKDFRLYWFVVFLLSLQFAITKNLNDGLAVIENLKIDYTIWSFTFEITATDIILLLLLFILASDHLGQRKPIQFPQMAWLALGFLGVCVLSLIGAPSAYLGLVELSRQAKLFVVFLFAVNFAQSKGVVKALVIVGMVILVTQAATTIIRFETGYLSPLTFGDSHQSLSQIEGYLAVDRNEEGSAIRAFGTLGSPGSTLRLCMMFIPFALFLCVPNPLFRMRFLFAALTAFTLGGLTLTFTRVYYITTGVQLVLAFLIMVRGGLLKRQEIKLIVLLAAVGLAAISPKLYQQFTVREDSISVRFLQYEATGRMILDHPILGVGLNNSTAEKHNYSTLTYNEFDPNTQFYLEPTHNMYLALASEIGVIGTLLLLVFFGRATQLAWRCARGSPDPEIRLIGCALVVVFLSVAVNGLMDPLGEYPVMVLLWFYAGLAVNLAGMADRPGALRPQGVKPSPSGSGTFLRM